MAGANHRGILKPNINAPTAAMPTNEDFDFNPDGPGQLGALFHDPSAALMDIPPQLQRTK